MTTGKVKQGAYRSQVCPWDAQHSLWQVPRITPSWCSCCCARQIHHVSPRKNIRLCLVQDYSKQHLLSPPPLQMCIHVLLMSCMVYFFSRRWHHWQGYFPSNIRGSLPCRWHLQSTYLCACLPMLLGLWCDSGGGHYSAQSLFQFWVSCSTMCVCSCGAASPPCLDLIPRYQRDQLPPMALAPDPVPWFSPSQQLSTTKSLTHSYGVGRWRELEEQRGGNSWIELKAV